MLVTFELYELDNTVWVYESTEWSMQIHLDGIDLL